MKKKFLESVLEIPSYSKEEHHVKAFILDFARKHGIIYEEDSYGNVYLIKGELDEGEYYPCVIAHMDTVHEDNKALIRNNKKINVINLGSDDAVMFKGFDDDLNPIGIGGDDKAGIAIALDLITKNKKIKAAFFKEEETGCQGAYASDASKFSDVGYIMEFDAPSNNWISRVSWKVELFNDSFYSRIKDTLKRYGQTRINTNDPFTDIEQLKKKVDVNCINIFAGYYNQHKVYEHVSFNDVNKASRLGMALIKELKYEKHEFIYIAPDEPKY